ncbi:MAG: patatin-like phospholipase family protein [Acidobacteria bacterium]|nr:patatin-like phospholipase family protein [Acidobacteriota bacterium]
MLTTAVRDNSARVGLALAGGGPEGAIYEIGVLRAIDEALDGIDFNRLPVYVGVSAGAFVAANLANQITTAQNVRAIVKKEPGEHPFVPQTFFMPAVGELLRRGAQTPSFLLDALWDLIRTREATSLYDSAMRLSRVLPLGLFDNDPIREYLQTIYSMKGRSNDFRTLKAKLFIVATELDSGRAVRFGEKGLDRVPISQAIQASSALPGLYPPVVIDGRHYVDGVLIKTVHASVALEHGAGLVICVNPIVPVDTLHAPGDDSPARRLTELGLPTVLSQTFRTLIHSRMRVGMAAYAPRYPKQRTVLFEPQPDDYRMFFTNIFSFGSRKELAEYAYNATRRDLLRRYDELAPVFRRHGIVLRRDVLLDRSRNLWTGVGLIGGSRRDSVDGEMSAADRLGKALDALDARIAAPARRPRRVRAAAPAR